MPETPPPTVPQSAAPFVAPVVTPPAAPSPLTPEEKKAKRKAMLKRLARVGAIVYVLLLVLIFVWSLVSYGKEFTLFDYIPISQAGFSNFLMVLFNILVGLLVGGAMVFALLQVIKSLLIKKEEVEKKKKASRLGLYGGLSFLLLAVLWLLGIWFLGPRLFTEQRYGSPILTDPVSTVGLTSPISITFDASQIPIDTDTYSILAYTWTFGDGDTANGQTVTHLFTHKAPGNGIYTVTLNVEYMDLKSGARFDYETSKEVVIENELTAASFVATPNSGEIPLTVIFDATSSYDPDGEIVSYEWDFDGDARFDDAEGDIVEYEFTQEGSYEVTLRVTDNNNESATTSLAIEAGSVGGLRAVITPPVSEGVSYYLGEDYSFDGKLSQISEGNIVKYLWEFGDGSDSLQSRSVSHAFEAAGTYEVTLTIYDADGHTDSASLEVIVLEEGEAPVAKIKTDPELENGVLSGPVPLSVSFDGSGSLDPDEDIVDYEWDFENDGIIDETGDKVITIYEEIGSYEARLLVTDSVGNTDETTVSIEVTEQGVVAVLEIDVSNGEVPLTVKFDSSGSSFNEGNIVSYEYDFGDGSEIYIGGSTVTYKYTDVGTFTARVTVIGDDGQKDTTSVQIVVRPVSLTACFTVNTSSGSAPLFVAVDPSCSQGTIESYEWNFGDGEISFDRKPETHTYSEVGTYTITLEVTEDSGIVDTFTKTVTVK